jgi:hypothetical protein
VGILDDQGDLGLRCAFRRREPLVAPDRDHARTGKGHERLA